MNLIRFKGFKAVDEPELCQVFAKGHFGVLAKYGITNISTNNVHWMSNPFVYGIVAFNEKDEAVGGIRVQMSGENSKLPLEIAVNSLDDKVSLFLESFKGQETAEVCALWNSHSVAGHGFSIMLFHAGIALASMLKVEVLFTICAEYTLKMVESVGFKQINELGVNGLFEYPSSAYQARILRLDDLDDFKKCDPKARQEILSIRRSNRNYFVRRPKDKNYVVHYDLDFKKIYEEYHKRS